MARLYNACPKDILTELCEAAMTVRTIPPIGGGRPIRVKVHGKECLLGPLSQFSA